MARSARKAIKEGSARCAKPPFLHSNTSVVLWPQFSRWSACRLETSKKCEKRDFRSFFAEKNLASKPTSNKTAAAFGSITHGLTRLRVAILLCCYLAQLAGLIIRHMPRRGQFKPAHKENAPKTGCKAQQKRPLVPSPSPHMIQVRPTQHPDKPTHPLTTRHPSTPHSQPFPRKCSPHAHSPHADNPSS